MDSHHSTAPSEDYGGDWNDSPLPISARLANAAKNHPHKLALACLHQPPNLYGSNSLAQDHLAWSYSQLSAATDSLCSDLRERGLTPGTSIMTILDNGVEFVLCFWAAHRLGFPFVALNPRNLQNAEEMRYMLGLVEVGAVFVGSLEMAAAFDEIGYSMDGKVLKISAGEAGRGGWTRMVDCLAAHKTTEVPSTVSVDTNAELSPRQGIVTMLFTSGTTSMPKACPHTDLTLNAFTKNLELGGHSPSHTFCGVLPNNHAMGYFYVLHFFCTGGAVVYPSASFDAKQMAEALKDYSCTRTCLVPTALNSLVEYAAHDGLRFASLKDVCLAGASITPQHLRQIVQTLGAEAVSTGFGMTEGSPVWTAPVSDPETLIVGEDTVSGRASPGAHIRICAPDSFQPLPRGEPGEIHEHGPGVIAGYLNNVGAESFYTDQAGRIWFKTGDRAVMLPDGRVSVVGRFKDMIIRGGENIAPAAIESVLNQFPGVEAQVVGATDAFAGEVPVAVVRKLPVEDAEGNPTGLLQNAVRTSMGILHVPDEIITLHALGLVDYPRTMSGKIQKSVLRKLVSDFRKHNGTAVNGVEPHLRPASQQKSVEQTVLDVWWRATGIAPAALDKEAPTTHFADSITMMRVRDLYRKGLGLTLSAQEMSIYPSLSNQIDALQQKMKPDRKDLGHQSAVTRPSPTLDDIQLAIGSKNNAISFKKEANHALSKYGFDFDAHVDSVIPASDFTKVLIRTKIMDTWNFGIAIVADGSTVAALKQALTMALQQSPLWPSFYVLGDDGAPFYVTMKPHEKLYEQCLTDCGSVATLADLQKNAIEYPHPEHSVYPGLLFHALLYHVEELNSAAFVMYLHHAVHDASSMRLVLEDLNTSLRFPDRPLRSHVPFETWADIYQSLRNSPRATLEVDWHVSRLKNIHQHRKALYPPAIVPRQATTAIPDGADYGFDAPQLLDLKNKYPTITASIVLKAAMALVNITRTRHTHALFSNFEAARSSLPFWPETLRHLDGADGITLADLDGSDVAGPTMNAVTNLIEVDHGEAAIDFVSRLQSEQVELSKRSHAPWCRIIDELNALHPEHLAGEMIHETHQTQFLTWVPGFLGDYEKIRVAQIAIRAALGVVFVAGLGGPQATTYMISLRWDAANYSREQVMELVQDVEKAIKWLLTETNWALPVGEFLGQFE